MRNICDDIPRDQRWGEEWARRNGWDVVAGVDEAGRGPLAGPLVVAAVILPRDDGICGIKDSKKTSELQREALFPLIVSKAVCAVRMAGHERIDEVNILRATMESMDWAVTRLCSRLQGVPDLVIVDGPHLPPLLAASATRSIPLKKGDALSENVAAASIVAKVVRDRLMRRMALRYPGYGFERHKGYGTAAHLEALARLGPCPIHRRSFAGVEQR
ncbi:MAG: ribonuclease HII [Myxococcota bacterium]|jgi:ribonuclease HII